MYKLEDLRVEIDAHSAARLKALPEELGVNVSANGREVYDLLYEFASRPGKRIRGALAMVAYDMFGGREHRAALDLALAMELTQNYLLIVDDVMDRSDQRRGGETIHNYYQRSLRREQPASDYEHVGNMVGVSVGLVAQHLASRVLSEIDEAPERVVRAERAFQANIAATAFGQIDDLLNQAGRSLDLDGMRRMYMLKSGYYSFVNPLQLGAILAGADDEQLGSIREFGEQAGLAFQLQDDLLGMFGNEQATGKSSLDDLREGKLTLLMRHALEHGDGKQTGLLRAALGNVDVTEAQHAEVCRILEELGSREYVLAEAQRAAQAAVAVLDAQTAWNAEGRGFLKQLVQYSIKREK